MTYTPRELAIGAVVALGIVSAVAELLRLTDQARMAAEVTDDLGNLPETDERNPAP